MDGWLVGRVHGITPAIPSKWIMVFYFLFLALAPYKLFCFVVSASRREVCFFGFFGSGEPSPGGIVLSDVERVASRWDEVRD